MIRYLFLMNAVLMSAPMAHAADAVVDAKGAVRSMTEYCLPAIAEDTDAAAFATMQNFPELPPGEAQKFFPEPARVFHLPGMNGAAVMIVPLSGHACSIAIHKVNADSFWKAVDQQMGRNASFRMIREKRVEDEKITKRELEASKEGKPVSIFITASDSPRPNGIQVLMTAAQK